MKYKTGEYVLEKTGRWLCHTFVPYPLQKDGIVLADEELYALLAKAHRLIGFLNGMTAYIPDIDIYTDLAAKYESVLSCQIDGSAVTFADLWDSSKQKTIQKVIAYNEALYAGKNIISAQGLSLEAIRAVHKVLMNCEVPEEAGKFRQQQLIIQRGFSDSLIEYNPPNPEDMTNALHDLESYFNFECDYDVLVQAALVYYQFITIYPFTAGNGRMSRLITNLFFMEKGLLSQPLLWTSYYLLLRNDEYNSTIRAVRGIYSGYMPWVKFFVKSVIVAAEKTVDILRRSHDLRIFDYAKIQSLDRVYPAVLRIYEYIWKTPIIEVRHIAKDLGLSYNTVAKAVNIFLSLGVLHQVDGQKRYRKYAYTNLLDIFSLV